MKEIFIPSALLFYYDHCKKPVDFSSFRLSGLILQRYFDSIKTIMNYGLINHPGQKFADLIQWSSLSLVFEPNLFPANVTEWEETDFRVHKSNDQKQILREKTVKDVLSPFQKRSQGQQPLQIEKQRPSHTINAPDDSYTGRIETRVSKQTASVSTFVSDLNQLKAIRSPIKEESETFYQRFDDLLPKKGRKFKAQKSFKFSEINQKNIYYKKVEDTRFTFLNSPMLTTYSSMKLKQGRVEPDSPYTPLDIIHKPPLVIDYPTDRSENFKNPGNSFRYQIRESMFKDIAVQKSVASAFNKKQNLADKLIKIKTHQYRSDLDYIRIYSASENEPLLNLMKYNDRPEMIVSNLISDSGKHQMVETVNKLHFTPFKFKKTIKGLSKRSKYKISNISDEPSGIKPFNNHVIHTLLQKYSENSNIMDSHIPQSDNNYMFGKDKSSLNLPRQKETGRSLLDLPVSEKLPSMVSSIFTLFRSNSKQNLTHPREMEMDSFRNEFGSLPVFIPIEGRDDSNISSNEHRNVVPILENAYPDDFPMAYEKNNRNMIQSFRETEKLISSTESWDSIRNPSDMIGNGSVTDQEITDFFKMHVPEAFPEHGETKITEIIKAANNPESGQNLDDLMFIEDPASERHQILLEISEKIWKYIKKKIK